MLLTPADKINLVIAIATCISVVGSMAVALLTWHIAKSNRLTAELMAAQLESTTRPYVSALPMIQLGVPFLQLVIENLGQSGAEELRLRLSEDFFFNGEKQDSKNLRTYTAFSEPIANLAPKAKLIFDLGVGPTLFNAESVNPLRFVVSASYRHAGKTYEEATTIDLGPFELTSVPRDVVADEIGQLGKTLKDAAREIIQSRK